MATERDIDGQLTALAEAIRTDNDDLAKQATIALAGGVLKDLSRIADALQILATKGATQ